MQPTASVFSSETLCDDAPGRVELAQLLRFAERLLANNFRHPRIVSTGLSEFAPALLKKCDKYATPRQNQG
jgi:hypothetical protein